MGLVSRLALSPLASHPYDMATWAYYQRVFYAFGTLDFKYFPTLPVIYYLQLGAYSFYVLLTGFGLHDSVIFFHTNYAVEGFFLKAPMILADVCTFFLLSRFSKLSTACLYFLNPFSIFLSAAWGTYDSVMIAFLVAGFFSLERNDRLISSTAFCIAGLVKLFGFMPFLLLLLESIVQRRFKRLFLQMSIASAILLAVLIPIWLQGGVQDFFSGFALRFLGLSGARTRTWSILSAIDGISYGGATPLVWIAYFTIPMTFLLKIRKTASPFQLVLKLSIVGAVLLNILSQAEPQWLSWPIPLALMYSSVTRRDGLRAFAYLFGTIATFLVMTLTQGTGYLVFGLLYTTYLAPLEGFSGTLAVYAFTILCLLLLLVGYVFVNPVKLKLEVVAAIIIIYCQSYFWFAIVGVQNILSR